MTFLAYDPTQLVALLRRMRVATEELRALRYSDPETAAAMAAVASAANDLERRWQPIVRRVLSTAPLDQGRRHRDLDAINNAVARQMATERGWLVADDPTLDNLATMTDVVALAERLTHIDLADAAADPATVYWLAARWRLIARSPALSAAFIEHFPRWTQLADALGRSQAQQAAGDGIDLPTALRPLDDALGGLSRVLQGQPLEWVDRVEPYTAALLIRTLTLGSAELAEVADHLLQLPRYPLDEAPAANHADVLLQALLRDPVACTRYLELAMAHPGTLFDHLTDPTLADRVVLTATDPHVVDEATAGRLVPSLIRWFDSEPSRDPGVLLADLVTPWTVQFSPTHHTWQLDTEQRNLLLGIALGGNGALQRFIDNEASVIAGARRTFSSRTAHRGELLSGWVGLIGGLVMNEKVRQVTLRRKSWDMLCNIAALAASLAPGMALGVTTSVAIMVVHDHLGPDVAKEQRNAVWGKSAAVTMAAVYLAKEVHRLWIANGRLPHRFAAPPELNTKVVSPSEQWYNDFEDWMFTLPGGIDGTMANEARHAVWAALNPWLVGELSSQA